MDLRAKFRAWIKSICGATRTRFSLACAVGTLRKLGVERPTSWICPCGLSCFAYGWTPRNGFIVSRGEENHGFSVEADLSKFIDELRLCNCLGGFGTVPYLLAEAFRARPNA